MPKHETISTDLDITDFVDEFTHCFTGECRVNVLPILYRITKAINDNAEQQPL